MIVFVCESTYNSKTLKCYDILHRFWISVCYKKKKKRKPFLKVILFLKITQILSGYLNRIFASQRPRSFKLIFENTLKRTTYVYLALLWKQKWWTSMQYRKYRKESEFIKNSKNCWSPRKISWHLVKMLVPLQRNRQNAFKMWGSMPAE